MSHNTAVPSIERESLSSELQVDAGAARIEDSPVDHGAPISKPSSQSKSVQGNIPHIVALLTSGRLTYYQATRRPHLVV